MKTLIILVAPSGAGKTSFLDRIVSELPVLEDIITYTTRRMREGESEGKPYHFITPQRFRELLDQDFFVEWACVHDNMYGTSRQTIEDAWSRGRVPIMDVDVQGARSLKKTYGGVAKAIFILPPSLEVLRQRILKRDGPSRDLELRMTNAEKELSTAGEFDFRVTNDKFDDSYQEFYKLVEGLIGSR